MKVYNDFKNEENKFIKIQIEVKNERQIIGSFIFYDSNKKELRNLNIPLDASEDLEYEGNKVKIFIFQMHIFSSLRNS